MLAQPALLQEELRILSLGRRLAAPVTVTNTAGCLTFLFIVLSGAIMPAEVPVLANCKPLLETSDQCCRRCLCCWYDLRVALIQPFQLLKMIIVAKMLSKQFDSTIRMLHASLLPQHLPFLIRGVFLSSLQQVPGQLS